MSRSLEIAAVVGTKSITKEVKQGDMVIVDGITGDVIVDPTEDELIAYQNKRERFFEDKKNYKNYVIFETVTIDGEHAELVANIGTPDDLYGVMENGVKESDYIELNSFIWVEIKCQQKMSNLKPIKSA